MFGLNIFKRNTIKCIPFFIFINYSTLCGKAHFSFSKDIEKAQNLIFELKLNDAEKSLNNLAILNKENIAVVWLQEYVLFYKNFILEEQDFFNTSIKTWDSYITAAEKLKTNDAWYRFILSDMYLHRAVVKLKMEANFSAGNDLKKANNLLK